MFGYPTSFGLMVILVTVLLIRFNFLKRTGIGRLSKSQRQDEVIVMSKINLFTYSLKKGGSEFAFRKKNEKESVAMGSYFIDNCSVIKDKNKKK